MKGSPSLISTGIYFLVSLFFFNVHAHTLCKTTVNYFTTFVYSLPTRRPIHTVLKILRQGSASELRSGLSSVNKENHEFNSYCGWTVKEHCITLALGQLWVSWMHMYVCVDSQVVLVKYMYTNSGLRTLMVKNLNSLYEHITKGNPLPTQNKN